MNIGNKMLAESKFYMGYSRWMDSENRYETWEESVERVMNMHRKKYADIMTPELENYLKTAQAAYVDKLVLGAQRALQFGGEQIFKHELRLYNCAGTHCNRPAFFNETLYALLAGCGVGFSVQKHHIDQLPSIARRSQKKVKVFQVPDSIEGWADALAVLLSSYFTEKNIFPEYKGCQVHFDYSKIRPKGALISGGFKAPGPDGLRNALIKCEDVIENLLKDAPVSRLNSISAYDITMHSSDAVLSGGVRRCLPEDTLVQIGENEWKELSEFIVNDKIYLFDELVNVTAVFGQGIQKVYKISLSDNTYLESTENHRWYVLDKETNNTAWVETKNLNARHVLKHNNVVGVVFSRECQTYDIEVGGLEHAFIAKHPVSGAIGISHNSACLCLFSKEDEEMLKAKTGNWFVNNPQRGRSNNSVLIIRDELNRSEWSNIMKSVKDFGEPGFVFADNKEFVYNPCLTGDTLVTVLDEEYQPVNITIKTLVESLRAVKSVVLSYNIKTKETEYCYVTNGALTQKNADIIKLTFSDDKTIKCTPNHEIYTTNRGYVKAYELNIDDNFINDKLEEVQLTKMEDMSSEDVYDITVRFNHNFFANGILVHNCVEIGLLPVTESGESGFQFCNLTEINGGKCTSPDIFYEACETAAILGTIQAGYTNFKYMSAATKQITEREALIGCSVTGVMNNPDVFFNKETLAHGVQIIKDTNKKIAAILGINQAARVTCLKPAGSSCCRIETKIKTNKGIMSMIDVLSYLVDKTIDDIEPSTFVIPNKELFVYDENNDLQKIKAFYNNGESEVYEITFEDGNTYGFTSEHKLKTKNGWKHVKDLTEEDDIISF